METIKELHNYAKEQSDPRVKNWFLLGDPLPNLCIWLTYMCSLFIVPHLMKHRKPFELKQVLFLYNVVMVILSIYMAYEFTVSAVLGQYSLLCQPVDYSDSPVALRMASVSWVFYFSKVIELLDTLFFMLRKKNNQVSFLHVYHHSTMIWNWWLGANYIPGGQSFFNGAINSSVHVVMYSYYALTTFGPRIQPYLWWKKYITQLQLTQFVIVLVHTSYNLFFEKDCKFPKVFLWMVFGYCLSLIVLFSNFYYSAYKKHRQSVCKQKNGKHLDWDNYKLVVI